MTMILSHSVIPHAHHENSLVFVSHLKEVKTNQGIFEWLKTLFQQDLGHEHLEDYNPVDSANPDLSAAYVMVALAYVQILQSEEVTTHYQVPSQHSSYPHFYKDTEPLRGPPTVTGYLS